MTIECKSEIKKKIKFDRTEFKYIALLEYNVIGYNIIIAIGFKCQYDS